MADDKGLEEKAKIRTLEDDADLLGDEPRQDILFQTQMAIANLFLGYWKFLLYAAGAVLVVAAIAGTYLGHVQSTQRDGHQAVAKAGRGIENIVGDISEAEVNEILAQTARDIEAAAASTDGTARAYGYVQAAQIWMQLDDAAAARRAFEEAGKVKVDGVLAWSISMGASHAAAVSDDLPGARAALSKATSFDGVMGEQAVFTRLQLEVKAGDTAAATASATELETRFPKSGRIAEAKALAGRAGSAG